MARSAARGGTTATFVQVLEYMDGPQVVLLERSPDNKIIGVAIDTDEEGHYFFGSSISFDQWDRYRRGLLDLRFLLMFPRWKRWHSFNLDNLQADKSIRIQSAEKDEHAEENYLPDSGFFAYDHSEPIRQSEIGKRALQKYTTDGIWDLPDFTEFYHRLNDLYVFNLSLQKFQSSELPLDERRNIRDAFVGAPLKGGSSYVNLYTQLTTSQDLGERLSVGRLQYASPGHVDVRGRSEIFQELNQTYMHFQDNYIRLKTAYSDIYKFLQRNKLLRADAERFDNSGGVAKFLVEKSSELSIMMALDNTDLIYDLTGKNGLKYTKVILSFFRRAERYFMFFAEGRVNQPEMVDS